MKRFLQKLDKPIYKHIAFWIVVFLFYTTSARDRFDSTEEIVITYFFHILFQVIVAYSILIFIIPRYKKNNNILESILLVVLLFFIVNFFRVAIRMYFLEPLYPNCYKTFLEANGDLTFIERIFNFYHILITIPLFYLQPLFFLIALRFYEKEYKRSQINEQKRIDELKALRHQLNPHFLFNNLNNLYLLTVEKSDKAPEVIEKLSSMLDYMLYGCEETFVAINKEVELIENYLALEQIRYDDRVNITFKNTVSKNVKIAPLLLLTFIENAFKHGVKNELNTANVIITLTTNNDEIIFTIFNTKPTTESNNTFIKKSIGLTNVQRQLNLIYPEAHTLKTENKEDSFFVSLHLKNR